MEQSFNYVRRSIWKKNSALEYNYILSYIRSTLRALIRCIHIHLTNNAMYIYAKCTRASLGELALLILINILVQKRLLYSRNWYILKAYIIYVCDRMREQHLVSNCTYVLLFKEPCVVSLHRTSRMKMLWNMWRCKDRIQ